MTDIYPTTVADMAALIAQRLQTTLDEPVWIDGTLGAWRRSGAYGTGELITYDHYGKISAKLRIGTPGNIAARLEKRFAEAGVELAAGMNISVRAVPELHPRYGLRLHVTDIASEVTISDDRRRYEEVLKELTEGGLSAHQKALELHAEPGQSLGLITPRTGDAARADVLEVFRRLDIHPTEIRIPISGPNAVTAIPSAITRLSSTDVILIIRGGGDASDIAIFNNRRVVTAVATSAVPVILGVGHATDSPLAEQAAYHAASTPTAAAHWIAEHVAGVQPAIAARLHEVAPQPVHSPTPFDYSRNKRSTPPPALVALAALGVIAVIYVVLRIIAGL